MEYSEKAQLAKYKSGFKSSSPTKFNRQAPMTFAKDSYAPEVKAKLQPTTSVPAMSMGKSFSSR